LLPDPALTLYGHVLQKPEGFLHSRGIHRDPEQEFGRLPVAV